MKIPDSRIDQLLEAAPSARLATLNPDGSPHQVPIVFTCYKGNFWSPIDGKPKRQGQLARVRNIIADNRGSLLIDHYDNNWAGLWWIRVDVRIGIVQLADGPEDGLAMVIAGLEEKYPQYETTPVLGDPPTLLCMAPVSLRSWCSSDIILKD